MAEEVQVDLRRAAHSEKVEENKYLVTMEVTVGEDGAKTEQTPAEAPVTCTRDAGVSGLECYYSGYSPEVCARLNALAAAYGFCATAGSDWHGSHKPHIEMGSGMHGELNAPYELLAKLREREKCHGFSK